VNAQEIGGPGRMISACILELVRISKMDESSTPMPESGDRTNNMFKKRKKKLTHDMTENKKTAHTPLWKVSMFMMIFFGFSIRLFLLLFSPSESKS
jgi:hypothetical protein